MKTEPKQSCQNIAAKTECSALLLLYCELSIPYTVWAMTSGRYERQVEATTSTTRSGGGDTNAYVRLFVVGARVRVRLGKTTAAGWWKHGMVCSTNFALGSKTTVQVRFGQRQEDIDVLSPNVELTALSPDDLRHIDISPWQGKKYDYKYSPPSPPSSSSSSSSSSRS